MCPPETSGTVTLSFPTRTRSTGSGLAGGLALLPLLLLLALLPARRPRRDDQPVSSVGAGNVGGRGVVVAGALIAGVVGARCSARPPECCT